MSLRGRVTLATVLTLGGGLAILGVTLNLLLANRLSADADTVLSNRAAALLSTLNTRGPRLRVHEGGGDAVLDEQAWIFDRNGREIEAPPVPGPADAVARSLADVRAPTRRKVGEHIRLLAQPAERGAGVVVAGVSLAPYARTEHFALVGTVLLGVFVLAAGALLTRRAVGMALRPVADMTQQAAKWGEQDLRGRFALGPARDELTALAATLDGLLGRIEAALRHEQRFSAEMAHELRTPLSGVRGEAELALRFARSDAELRAALEAILAGTERMETAIETLLTAARSEGGGAPGSSDAAAIVRSLAGPKVSVNVPEGTIGVGAEQGLVAAALHPLVENAVRHAARQVRVELARDGADVVVAVSNDGPEIPLDDVERIFAPGVSGAGGAGLGLPLARRLARAAGGDVTARAPEPRFELRLPAS
jgi:two-component system, OmpR family, sensor kinase